MVGRSAAHLGDGLGRARGALTVPIAPFAYRLRNSSQMFPLYTVAGFGVEDMNSVLF